MCVAYSIVAWLYQYLYRVVYCTNHVCMHGSRCVDAYEYHRTCRWWVCSVFTSTRPAA